MALDNRDFNAQDTVIVSSASQDSERSWWWTPEPVRLEHAPALRSEPARFDVISGSFRFPCALVDARAQALVEDARRDGARHALSLWRAALRDALERVCREAAHAPASASCVALFCDRVGEEYHAAVTFEVAARPAGGRPRH